MYIQITTRCNMVCGHCCYSCTSKGQNMSMKTFKAAVVMASHYSGSISIGGGEPTVHPKFWEMLGYLLGQPDIEYIWLATNGKRTDDALALARLAKSGVISVSLSLDGWHEAIDAKVEDAFKRTHQRRSYMEHDHDARDIRTTEPDKVKNAGRCDFGEDGCVCPEFFVMPSGNVRVCGCADAPIIGNVYSDIDFGIFDGDEYEPCHKHMEG